MGKNWVWGDFSCFSADFSYFSGEAIFYIFPIVFLFRAGGPKRARNGVCTRQTGPQVKRNNGYTKTLSSLFFLGFELVIQRMVSVKRLVAHEGMSGLKDRGS